MQHPRKTLQRLKKQTTRRRQRHLYRRRKPKSQLQIPHLQMIRPQRSLLQKSLHPPSNLQNLLMRQPKTFRLPLQILLHRQKEETREARRRSQKSQSQRSRSRRKNPKSPRKKTPPTNLLRKKQLPQLTERLLPTPSPKSQAARERKRKSYLNIRRNWKLRRKRLNLRSPKRTFQPQQHPQTIHRKSPMMQRH